MLASASKIVPRACEHAVCLASRTEVCKKKFKVSNEANTLSVNKPEKTQRMYWAHTAIFVGCIPLTRYGRSGEVVTHNL